MIDKPLVLIANYFANLYNRGNLDLLCPQNNNKLEFISKFTEYEFLIKYASSENFRIINGKVNSLHFTRFKISFTFTHY